MREWTKALQEKPSRAQLEAIRFLDTCMVTDAIARLKVRLRNQGYSNGRVQCMLDYPEPMLGYAVTGRIRSAEPPVMGRRFVERRDWFKYVMTIPEPRVVVLEDIDHVPGSGAFWDGVHARIHSRLGCVGAVTNGAVRDLSKIKETNFYLFASHVSAAQGYAHIVDVGGSVEVAGLVINPGDLIHGDRHGFVLIPREVVAQLPETAGQILETRSRVAELCSSAEFSIDKLMVLLNDLE